MKIALIAAGSALVGAGVAFVSLWWVFAKDHFK